MVPPSCIHNPIKSFTQSNQTGTVYKANQTFHTIVSNYSHNPYNQANHGHVYRSTICYGPSPRNRWSSLSYIHNLIKSFTQSNQIVNAFIKIQSNHYMASRLTISCGPGHGTGDALLLHIQFNQATTAVK